MTLLIQWKAGRREGTLASWEERRIMGECSHSQGDHKYLLRLASDMGPCGCLLSILSQAWMDLRNGSSDWHRALAARQESSRFAFAIPCTTFFPQLVARQLG